MKDCKALGGVVRDSGVQVIFHQSSYSKGRGLKEPVECNKSTRGDRSGATAKGLTTSEHGTVIEKPDHLGLMGSICQRRGRASSAMGLKPGNLNPSHSYECDATACKKCPEAAEGSHSSRRAPEKQHKEFQPLQLASLGG